MTTTQEDVIQQTCRGSGYRLAVFQPHEIEALRDRIITRTRRGKQVPFVRCIVRDRDVWLGPEEVVRQLYAARLIAEYGYPKDRLTMDYKVSFGLEEKTADIAVTDKDRTDAAHIIVELTSPGPIEGRSRLRSYCNAAGAPMGVWTNGRQVSHYSLRDPNCFEPITDIPNVNQSLPDILGERFTLKDLVVNDRIASERKSLKDAIIEIENEVLANSGVDVFEEVFKLIFAKLYDEFLSRTDKAAINHFLHQGSNSSISAQDDTPAIDESNTQIVEQDHEALRAAVARMDDTDFREMEFRNTGQTGSELRAKIQDQLRRAIVQWPGVFQDGETLELSDSHLAVCVSSLQDVRLFDSNLLVLDEAFEYLVVKSAKDTKGQFFTPRHVIDMCVKMLNPRRGEYMIDTASGSGGFLFHTVSKFTGQPFTDAQICEEDKEDALRVFGIDFDEKAVRIARALNLIVADGEANVLHLDALDYERWGDRTERDENWIRTYGRGFERLKRLRAAPGQNKRFNFDLVMANPPFAGHIKEGRVLHQYQLGLKGNRARASVGRDVLFLERNLDFLRPGGRLAVVLPQGRLNNTSDKYIREFIFERARLLAVVGLDQNTFKPHTATKTSVLFLQKWNDDPVQGPLCPRVKDYPVFMAVSEKGGKDGSGDYVYARDASGQPKLDRRGHLIVDHDLHAHAGELPPGIAEAFVEWGKAEGLAFLSDACAN